MKLWELVNPSDRVTFRAVDLQIALFVCIAIGDGGYPAKEILDDGQIGQQVPMFLFNGEKLVNEFCMENWNLPWEQVEAKVISERRKELCDALTSFIYGDVGDRKLIEELLAALPDDETRAARLAEWNEERRTSQNNIVAAAAYFAEQVRLISDEEEEKVPSAATVQ